MEFFITKTSISNPSNTWVFNQKMYHESNQIGETITCGLKKSTGKTLALINFQETPDSIVSLPRCPSAGLQFFDVLNKEQIQQLINQLLSMYEDKNIIIKQSPDFYQQHDHSFLSEMLFSAGFKKASEINHHIDLTSAELSKSIHQMQRRRIEKCQKSGFTFSRVQDAKELYAFIARCRRQQHLKPNIAKDQFDIMLSKMHDSYWAYSVQDMEGNIAACTVILRVNDEIIYNFLPAFDRAYSHYSPMAFLQQSLYDELKGLGFKTLDLGISSINGEPQEGLVHFKEKMGGIDSRRHIYTLYRHI